MNAVEQIPIGASNALLAKHSMAQMPPATQTGTGSSGTSLTKLLGFGGAGLAAGGALGAAAKFIGFKLPLVGSVTGLAGIARLAGIGAGAGLAVAAAPAVLELAQENPLVGNMAIGGALGAAAGFVLPFFGPMIGGALGAAAGAVLHLVTNNNPQQNLGKHAGSKGAPYQIHPAPLIQHPGTPPQGGVPPAYGKPPQQPIMPHKVLMTPYGPVKPSVSLWDRIKYAFTGVPPIQTMGYGGIMPAFAGPGMLPYGPGLTPPVYGSEILGKEAPYGTRTTVDEDGSVITVPLTEEDFRQITGDIENIVHGIIPGQDDDESTDADTDAGNGVQPPAGDPPVAATPDDEAGDDAAQEEQLPTAIDLADIPMDDAPDGEPMVVIEDETSDAAPEADEPAEDLPSPSSSQ